ncbi:MAG: FMN-binding negative transcriptional regulator [Haliea sp.]|nr:FMN-binding negative transcriptional regulator [Haliea sp.]
MYIPKHFEVTDRDVLCAFINENAFGQLVSTVGGRLFSTHMPFLLSDDSTRLIGHIARQNPQHAELDGQEVLITLQGPHDYISPSWYASAGVPTWNYQAVHIYGRGRVFDDTDALRSVVAALTEKYEAAFERPWQPDYKAAMLSAIVGVEVTISEIQGKFKLSQNRPAQDQRQVVTQLKAQGADALAAAMERYLGSE